MRAYRPRSPPPPPPQPPQPPKSAQSSGTLPQRPPSPQRPPPPPRPQAPQRQIWIRVSDGTYALANGSTTMRRGYTGSIKITSDEKGTRVVKEEPLDPGFEDRMAALDRSFTGVREKKPVPQLRPPPPKTPPAPTSTEEGGWLSTRSRPLTSTPRRPPRWVSPPPQRPRTPPPQRPRSPSRPYQGIVVKEVPQRPQTPPPPYKEVAVERSGDAVRGKYFFGGYLNFFFFFS